MACEEIPCNCPETCQEECTYPLPPVPCTDGCIDVVYTDCIKNSAEITLCGNVIPIKTKTLTELLALITEALDCQNVPCDEVIKTLSFSYTGLTKSLSYYQTLDPSYFTKSDIVTSIGINDNSTVTGDTLSYLEYSSLPLLTQYLLTALTLGSTFNLSTNICGNNLISTSNEIWLKMLTTRSCFETKMCTLDATQVPYSERYTFPYRANFQINEPPITNTPGIDTSLDKGTLYFNDVLSASINTSDGGIIRKINLNTGELITLAGNIATGLTPVTYNNIWGDVVEYDFNSSVVLDKNERVNGEPVIYFCTFGGVVCRLVRERNDQCDERANWKNYIIAGANAVGNFPTVTGLGGATTGTLARFANPFGIKKWYSVNGEPSFFVSDKDNTCLKFVYYVDGVGGKNSSENWNVVNMNFTITSSLSENINVEDNPNDPTEKRLIVFQNNRIMMVDYIGAGHTLVELTDPLSYSSYFTNVAGLGVTDGNGTVAQVYNPSWIARIGDISTTYYYVFGQGASNPNVTPQTRMLRKIEEGAAPTGPADYTFSTLIPSTGTNPDGYVGAFSTDAVVRYTQGIFADLQGNYYDIGKGGIRLYDFGSNKIDSVLSGASSLANSTITTVIDSLPMDTQYQLTLNCA